MRLSLSNSAISASAIGNFDGVHLGHQSVINIARKKAATAGRPHGVVTFEPHPRQFFDSQTKAFRLMNAEIRARRMSALGVDVLFEIPFDAALSQLTAEAFSRDILACKLGFRTRSWAMISNTEKAGPAIRTRFRQMAKDSDSA